MALRDKDKQDIVAWLSGLGTESSDAHAERLIDEDPEAEAFAREIRGVSELLRMPPAADEPLGEAESEAVTARLLARYQEAGGAAEPDVAEDGIPVDAAAPRGRRRPATWLRLTALAATLALVASGVWWGMAASGRHVASVSFYTRGTVSTPTSETISVEAGERIDSGGRVAIVDIRGDTQLVLSEGSSVTIGRDGKTVTLDEGSAYIIEPDVVRCLMGDTQTRLSDASAMLAIGPGKCTWYIYKGDAVISREGTEITVTEPRMYFLARSSGEFTTLPLDREMPEWVTRLLTEHRYE